MKKLLSMAVLSAVSIGAHAAPAFSPAGSNLTYGVNNTARSVISATTNPAASSMAFKEGESRFRFGILSSIGMGYEIGQVDNFSQELDVLINQTNTNFTSQAEADAFKSKFNALLPKMATDGYINFMAGAQVPLTPILIASEAMGGALTIDVNVTAQGRLNFLNDAAGVDYLCNGGSCTPLPAPPVTISLDSKNNSFMVSGAKIVETGLGYSRPLIKQANGTLFAGVKAKMYQVGLTRTMVAIGGMQNQQTGDVIKDEFDKNMNETSGLGLDLGVIWAAENWNVGATALNVNGPSFDFKPMQTTGCTVAANCTAANYFVSNGAISQNASYKMDPQLRLEGGVHSASRRWVATAAYDANAVKDAVGNEFQWAVASLAYDARNFFLPGIRAGYRANLAGTQMSYATAGLSLFSLLNLDLAYGLESVVVDGEKAPRAVMVNLGLEMRF